jgi:hypothetical protein
LQLDRKPLLEFRVGDLTVRMDASAVTGDPDEPYSVGSDLKVEGLLPAGVLKNYEVVIDYQRRTLTLVQPGARKPAGVPVPARVNDTTGLVTVEALRCWPSLSTHHRQRIRLHLVEEKHGAGLVAGASGMATRRRRRRRE